MATTSLIVETLIAGLQALLWLTLGLILFRGTAWVNLVGLKDWVSILLLLVLAVAYVLGIVVERSASFFIRMIDVRLERQNARTVASQKSHKSTLSSTKLRMNLMKDARTLSDFIEGYRRQYRMLASTAINLGICLMLLLLAYAFPGWVSQEAGIQYFAHTLAPLFFYFLGLLLVGTLLNWWHMFRNFHEYVQYAATIIGKPDKSEQPQQPAKQE